MGAFMLVGCAGGSPATQITITQTVSQRPASSVAPSPVTPTASTSESPSTAESSSPSPAVSATLTESAAPRGECLTAPSLENCVKRDQFTDREWQILVKNPDQYLGLETVFYASLSGELPGFGEVDEGWSAYTFGSVAGFWSPRSELNAALLISKDRKFITSLTDDDCLYVRGKFVGTVGEEEGYVLEDRPVVQVRDWVLLDDPEGMHGGCNSP